MESFTKVMHITKGTAFCRGKEGPEKRNFSVPFWSKNNENLCRRLKHTMPEVLYVVESRKIESKVEIDGWTVLKMMDNGKAKEVGGKFVD